MVTVISEDTAAASPELPAAKEDPGLFHLNRAVAYYRELQEHSAIQAGELRDVRSQLERLQLSNAELAQNLAALQNEFESERQRVKRERERSQQLTRIVKDLNRALFGGNVYDLILRACLTLTGATRGLYVVTRGPGDPVRIRAAVNVDGYPQKPPSDFIKELCYRVLRENDTIVCNSRQDLADLPAPDSPDEQFRNCAAAPVILLRHFNGIIIAADKVSGEFDEEDIETLLAVGDQATVAVENVRLQRALQSAYLMMVSMLADAVEAKDPYTRGHCDMVARFARLTAERMKLPDEDRSVVCYAALLHDIGKIGVSDGILNKPGRLLPEERDLVRSHVRVGYDLLARVPVLERVAYVVLHHHEWYDGSGYPDGLKANEIPIASRIVGVSDAYCAMITRRPYKETFSDERARQELELGAGTQFDPAVVEAFISVLDSPTSDDWNAEDDDTECGLLPGFGPLRNFQESVA